MIHNSAFYERLDHLISRSAVGQINVSVTFYDDGTGYIAFQSPCKDECWVGKSHSMDLALEAAIEQMNKLAPPHL